METNYYNRWHNRLLSEASCVGLNVHSIGSGLVVVDYKETIANLAMKAGPRTEQGSMILSLNSELYKPRVPVNDETETFIFLTMPLTSHITIDEYPNEQNYLSLVRWGLAQGMIETTPYELYSVAIAMNDLGIKLNEAIDSHAFASGSFKNKSGPGPTVESCYIHWKDKAEGRISYAGIDYVHNFYKTDSVLFKKIF